MHIKGPDLESKYAIFPEVDIHNYAFIYKVGCTSDGRITAAEVDLYSNAGNSLDLSSAVSFFFLLYIFKVIREGSIK